MRFGYDNSAQNAGGYKSASSGPRVFWMPPGTETVLVLLDDLPCQVCRHQPYIKGDKTAAKMRLTCAGDDPGEYQRPVPRMCIACNAMLRNKSIGRKGYAYLTVIEEREFQWKGKTYRDMKSLLELDPKTLDLWARRRNSYGGLVGAKFKVYRSQKQNSSRYGDDWQFIEKVDLQRNFWESPGVISIVEAKQKAGERIEHAEAVKLFTTRYPYETMFVYDKDEATAFVEYCGGGAANTQGGQQQQQTNQSGRQSGGYKVPPAPPSGGQPDYSTQAVPAGQAPTVPPQQQQQQQQQAGAPPWNTGQQAAPPPPPTPDPTQASPPPQGYQAPPLPPPAQPVGTPQRPGDLPGTATVEMGGRHVAGPAPTVPPPPAQQAQIAPGNGPVPGAQPVQNQQPTAPAAAGPVGNDYDFESGWNNSEPF